MTDTSGYRRRRYARERPADPMRPDARYADEDTRNGRRARGNQYREEDAADREIDRAMNEGRPVDMEAAFPEPPVDPNATPYERLRRLKKTHPDYYKAYRLKLVHRMTLRGLPLDVIAGQLQVSLKSIQDDKRELRSRMANEAGRLNANVLVGEAQAFYREIRATAMRRAIDPKLSPDESARQLVVAMRAMEDETKFLVTSGFWRAQKWTPHGGEEKDEADALKRLTHALVQCDEEGVDKALVEIAAHEDDNPEDGDGFDIIG